ncbi:hypothetical protein F4777DRAFT_71631 [Nemania sp. FL0916]|nr:hypothetical protein F4777DRAFT_71631 [Nemania sp. FL0916]
MHIPAPPILALLGLLQATAHATSVPLPGLVPGPLCLEAGTPLSFSLSEFAYLRYEVSASLPPTGAPNTTQLVFALENAVIGVVTGCALQNVMLGDGSGEWVDDSETWYACVDRTVVDPGGSGIEWPVKTSARIDWAEWRLAINQTWGCDESVSISQFSALTLEPTCTENKTGSQYIMECTAPDIIVSATPDEGTVL